MHTNQYKAFQHLVKQSLYLGCNNSVSSSFCFLHVDVKWYLKTSVKLHLFAYICATVKSEIIIIIMWVIRTTELAKNPLRYVVKYNYSYIRTNI